MYLYNNFVLRTVYQKFIFWPHNMYHTKVQFLDGEIRTVKINIQGPVVQNLKKLLANMTLKFLSWNMANILIFFAEKMWVAFAMQKLLTFLLQNYQCIWKHLSYNDQQFVINKLIKLTMLWTAVQ